MFYWLFHWFFRITGFIPQLIGFRYKVYYEDKSVQGRRIKGKAILMSNHQSVMDVALYLFVFLAETPIMMTRRLPRRIFSRLLMPARKWALSKRAKRK